MNDTVATEDQEQPAGCHQRKARVADRDPGRRTSSGPADICSAPTEAGHMTAANQIVRSAKKVLAMEGRSLIACPLSMIFFVAASGHGSLRGRNNPPQHLVRRKHRRRNVQNELACNDAAQGAPSQPPVPSPGGQPSHLLSRSMNLRNNGVKWRLRAPTNGMVVPNARCYAG